jgi:hypothetical protein
MRNRHLADELADVRAALKPLKARDEAELRSQLLADDADRFGLEWEAEGPQLNPQTHRHEGGHQALRRRGARALHQGDQIAVRLAAPASRKRRETTTSGSRHFKEANDDMGVVIKGDIQSRK